MAIIRGKKPDSNFYVLDKAISDDVRLSWAARGMLIFLLGKPDGWSVSVEHLQRQTESSRKPTGRDGVYSIISELMECGYVSRKIKRDSNGKMSGYDYIVNENPESNASQFTAEPFTAEPYTANTTLVSINNTNKDREIVKDAGKPATKSARKKDKTKLSDWIDSERAAGRKLIAADDALYDDGYPRDFVVLAWKVFVETVGDRKQYADWRQAFRNYVRNDYLRLWAIGREGQYFLTTAGKQAAMRHGMDDLVRQ